MFFLFGIGMIVVGLVCLYAKDFVWELTERQNRNAGVASERTPQWEQSINISGVISIIVGVFFIFYAFTSS